MIPQEPRSCFLCTSIGTKTLVLVEIHRNNALGSRVIKQEPRSCSFVYLQRGQNHGAFVVTQKPRAWFLCIYTGANVLVRVQLLRNYDLGSCVITPGPMKYSHDLRQGHLPKRFDSQTKISLAKNNLTCQIVVEGQKQACSEAGIAK